MLELLHRFLTLQTQVHMGFTAIQMEWLALSRQLIAQPLSTPHPIYRLKENVEYSWDATGRLKQLKPARFNFIANADITVDGFLAHEVSSIVPEAITGTKDKTRDVTDAVLSSDGKLIGENIAQDDWAAGKLETKDAQGNSVDSIYPSDSTWTASHTEPVMQQIDQSKLVPLLVKTIQELEARIATLEAK